MPAVTECTINGNFAGFRRQDRQNLINHDGPVGTRGGLARREDPGDLRRVALRIVFLVFLGEPARMRSGVAQAPPGGGLRCGIGVAHAFIDYWGCRSKRSAAATSFSPEPAAQRALTGS